MDIFNGIKEQLSSCPERTRALCRTVWGTLSLSLSTALQAASIEDARGDPDPGGGGPGGGGGGGSGRFATIMGAVKSRSITSADVDADADHPHPHSHHQNLHSMLRNGHQPNNGGHSSGSGTLQKQDLRYDIGCSSQYQHVRQPSLRSRSQQPMPTTDELDRRFAKVLVSLENYRDGLI